ncbi:hypothetical protein ACS0TY_034814 [Phlomoides rotata]
MSFFTFITGSTKSWQPGLPVNTTTASYWLNWRILLCSLWILMSMVFASILISKHECRKKPEENQEEEPAGVLYEDEVWKPCLRSIHPCWLLAFRVFSFILLLLMLILNVAVDNGTIFLFYTQWTFTLVTLYFGLGSLLSIRGCLQYKNRGDSDEHSDTELGSLGRSSTGRQTGKERRFRKKAGCLAYVFQIIYQMNAGAVILTDTVFWFIIVPFLVIKDYRFNFLLINMHSINAVLLLGDTALNCLRFPWFRIGYFFLWTCVYVVFQWILHACEWIWWPYPFLDLSSSYAPLWYSTVALMHIPCYGIFVLIIKGKHSVLSKWFPQSYRNAHTNTS